MNRTKHTIICDLDGTIADLSHRLHYIKNNEGELKESPDWAGFEKACIDDKPIYDVIDIVKLLWSGDQTHNPPIRNLKFFTGRSNVVRKNTVDWLLKNFFGISRVSKEQEDILSKFDVTLTMRNENDYREDAQVKLEMVKFFGLKPDNVLCIFEDRKSVVDMWRRHGYRVLQISNCLFS